MPGVYGTPWGSGPNVLGNEQTRPLAPTGTPTAQPTYPAGAGGVNGPRDWMQTGWNEGGSSPIVNAFQSLYDQGYRGEQLIQAMNSMGVPGGAFYPDSGNYALGGDFYVAPDASSGKLSLVSRGGGGM